MIHIVDSIMGSGKTSYVTNLMNNINHNSDRYIYVTPFLSEIDRVIKACPMADFHQPNDTQFKTKRDSLIHLLENGLNVAVTHALFRMLNHQMYHLLSDQGYTLIMDEVMECASVSNILTHSDLTMLIGYGHLQKDEASSKLIWTCKDDTGYAGKFNNVMNLCSNNNLALYGENVVIEEFPHEYLKAFKDVYVLTYLFEGSPMSAYLAKYGYDYEMLTLRNHEIAPWSDQMGEAEAKEQLRSLITIYQGEMNKVGNQSGKKCPLSVSWYNTQARGKSSTLGGLRSSTENFFKKVAGTPSKLNAWTTFCSFQSKLQGERYTKGFIAYNCRATNEHIEKQSMAYLCNVYPNPVINQHLSKQDVGFNPDLYALSEMVQWIWRSQIRRLDPISLFIPSQRMRDLLTLWLNTPSTPELIRKLT